MLVGLSVVGGQKWTATVYTSFNTDYSQLGVKPEDDNQLSQYKNSDPASTPASASTGE